MSRKGLDERIAENPFYVLGLAPDCSRQEVEREGQKLLSMLELKLSEAQRYLSPLGPRDRSPELVRLAMAELRDPQRRLVHELLAALPVSAEAPRAPSTGAQTAWPEAHRVTRTGPSPASGRTKPR